MKVKLTFEDETGIKKEKIITMPDDTHHEKIQDAVIDWVNSLEWPRDYKEYGFEILDV